MAKKKVKKNEYPKSVSKKAVEKAVEAGDLVKREEISVAQLILDLTNVVIRLEQRLDRIVIALSQSKSVKGM